MRHIEELSRLGGQHDLANGMQMTMKQQNKLYAESVLVDGACAAVGRMSLVASQVLPRQADRPGAKGI